ncbi:hypothetical protein ABPG72_007655 [Tetrahymena utriculariae]
MGQKFKSSQQKQDQSAQQIANKITIRKSDKKQKRFFIILAISGIVGAAFLYLSIINTQNKSRTIQVDENPDYFTSEVPHYGKQYHIKEHIKREAHPNFQKYNQKVKPEIDIDWIEHEREARYIVYKFLEYSNKTLDQQVHYEGKEIKWQPYLNIINDDKYCLKSDLYHLMHPDSINKNYLIFSDYDKTTISREVVTDFGIDLLPELENIDYSTKYTVGTKNMPLETTMIYSQISRMHHYFEINKQLFCNFQMANHIPGKWSITNKNVVIDNYREYQKKQFVDAQICKRTMTSMPRAFRLYDEDECKQFFAHIQSQEYEELMKKQSFSFLLKEGQDVHRGEGVHLFTSKLREETMQKYDKGSKCGEILDKIIAQKYISNPLKYEGYKLELRIYFLIASTNPLIIYVQKQNFLKKCQLPFDIQSTERASHICNISAPYGQSKSSGFDIFLEELTEYFLEKGIIKNPKWLEETIYPQIYRTLVHLVRSGQQNLLKDSRFFESFAVDLIIDENQRVWFLENNPNPQIMSLTWRRARHNYIMFGDMFQIQYAYLRSRALRLNRFAKFLLPLYQKYKTLDVSDFDRGFRSANQNDLEPEFENEIRKDSTYIKVYDDNLEGKKKFMGFLPYECLYQISNIQNNKDKDQSEQLQNKSQQQ